jgi:sphinganine-1-phosphate aldolase
MSVDKLLDDLEEVVKGLKADGSGAGGDMVALYGKFFLLLKRGKSS